MVFPISDDNSDLRTTPFVNWALIAVNLFVFAALQRFGNNERFTFAWATVPEKIRTGHNIDREVTVRDPITGREQIIPEEPTPLSVYLTLFTSMFMHANFLHIFGNMLYLWVFGDELEANYLGPVRFTIFYFICGLLAGFMQIAVNPTSTEPNLGASGAIAGVLGGFQVIFPRDRILVYIFPFWHVRITALLLTGFWFILQLQSGIGSITGSTQTQGGVAYFAHIGGFIAGMLLVKLIGIGVRPVGGQDYEQL